MHTARLPDGVEFVRVTADFDEQTAPPGLLAAHRVADGVWGRLVVRSGGLDLVFDGEPDGRRSLVGGDHAVLPPGARHHIELDGPVVFAVEFHRAPAGGTVGS
ncbi:MAG TPA: DUF1971 domain-containing protein [Ilumatobacter sp.]